MGSTGPPSHSACRSRRTLHALRRSRRRSTGAPQGPERTRGAGDGPTDEDRRPLRVSRAADVLTGVELGARPQAPQHGLQRTQDRTPQGYRWAQRFDGSQPKRLGPQRCGSSTRQAAEQGPNSRSADRTGVRSARSPSQAISKAPCTHLSACRAVLIQASTFLRGPRRFFSACGASAAGSSGGGADTVSSGALLATPFRRC